MLYETARSELTSPPHAIPFLAIVLEAGALVGTAALLLLLL
jgi:hypothetical protein